MIDVAFALIALFLAYKGWFVYQYATGLASLGLLFFDFLNVQWMISSSAADAAKELAGNPFAGLAAAAVQSMQVQFGFYVMVLGASCVLVSALVRGDKATVKFG